MTLEFRQSLTELNIIIHYMDIKYLKKLPQKFIEFINSNMDIAYKPNINKDVPINEQNIKKNTRVLLSLLYRNYWCNKEIKETLIKEDLLAKDKYESELKTKYSTDNIFKNKKQVIEQVQENVTSMIEYKEASWCKKIFENIKKLFMNLFKNNK